MSGYMLGGTLGQCLPAASIVGLILPSPLCLRVSR